MIFSDVDIGAADRAHLAFRAGTQDLSGNRLGVRPSGIAREHDPAIVAIVAIGIELADDGMVGLPGSQVGGRSPMQRTGVFGAALRI